MTTVIDVSRHLLCPVCKTLLEEPVSISCGHTFCKRCLDERISLSESQCPLCQEPVSAKPSVNEAIEALLQEFRQTLLPNPNLSCTEKDAVPCDICDKDFALKAIKSCLTCLLSYCDKHLKQHQSKARFKNHKLVNAVKELDKRSCTEHGRALELYCRRNECCICALCVKTSGDVIPVKSEREIREAKHQNAIEEMERKIKKREIKLEELKKSAEKCQARLEIEQNEIKEVMAAVMEAVRTSERMMIGPLREAAKSLEKEINEKTQQIQKDILTYKESIDFLDNSKNEEDDVLFLQSYPSVPAETNDDWTVFIETDLTFGTLRNTKAALLAEVETLLEKLCPVEISRIQRFAVDMILDTETAHPDLEVSTNGKAVRDSGRNSGISPGRNRFDQVGGILGKSSITSGKAFWMVDVGKKVGWQLGVMKEGANMKGKISYKPSEGYWAIVLCGPNMYGAFEDPPIMLQLSSKPQKLGVFVDCEAALVSFYDMEAQTHIYTYSKCRFNGAIRPYFNPHLNRDGNNASPLVICDVKHSDFCV